MLRAKLRLIHWRMIWVTSMIRCNQCRQISISSMLSKLSRITSISIKKSHSIMIENNYALNHSQSEKDWHWTSPLTSRSESSQLPTMRQEVEVLGRCICIGLERTVRSTGLLIVSSPPRSDGPLPQVPCSTKRSSQARLRSGSASCGETMLRKKPQEFLMICSNGVIKSLALGTNLRLRPLTQAISHLKNESTLKTINLLMRSWH